MKGLKKLSSIFISAIICIFSAVLFTGCDKSGKSCKLYVFSTQGGYVLVDDGSEPVEFGDEGSKTFMYGKGNTVKLKAVAEQGYDFIEWECTDKLDESVDLTNEQIEFKISDAEVVIRAKFVLDGTVKYTVTWEQSENFQIVPLEGYSAQVDLRGTFKFKINPVEGYDFSRAEVKANDAVLTPDVNGVYTITNIAKDINITVGGQVKNEYEISVNYEFVHGVLVVAEEGYTFFVEHGDDFKFKVDVRDDGYDTENMEVYAGEILLTAGVDGVYTISNITSDVMIVLKNVQKRTFDISYTEDQGYSVIPVDGYALTDIEYGYDCKFTVEIDDGYIIDNLQVYATIDDDMIQLEPDEGVYTIEGVASNITIIVEGVIETPQTPPTPEATTFTFNILFTNDIISENGDVGMYMPEEISFTLVEGEGEQEYNSIDYPSVFNSDGEEYSAKEFETMINQILQDDLWIDKELYGFASSESLDTVFMVFNSDSFTIDWDWIPNVGNIYMIFV